MWLELVIDVFWPSREVRSAERLIEKGTAGTIPVDFRAPGAFKRRLNESGWLADDVVAAGVVRQGRPHSMLSLITGAALIELVRPRRSKSLPRAFALAVTADRVVAFAMSPWGEGDGTTDRVVRIKSGERASWHRACVRLVDPPKAGEPRGASLEFGTGERLPVAWDSDPSTDELVELLGR